MGCGGSNGMLVSVEHEAMAEQARTPDIDIGGEVMIAVLKNSAIVDWIPAVSLCEKEKCLRVKIKNSKKARQYQLEEKENDIPWIYVRRPDPSMSSTRNPFSVPMDEIQRNIDRLKASQDDLPYVKRLYKEVTAHSDWSDSPIIFVPSAHNVAEWDAAIRGPSGTVYEHGSFILKLTFNDKYPFQPPKLIFVTPVFHPNISQRGRVCLNMLSEEWSPLYTVKRLLYAVRDLLSEPNPSDPLNNQAADMMKTNIAAFQQQAHQWVERYAQR